jgi:hypothetical protein
MVSCIVTEMAGIKNANDGWFCRLALGTGRQASTILQACFGHRETSLHYSAPMDLSTLKDETIMFFQNIITQRSDMPSHSRTDNSSQHWRVRFVQKLTTKHLSSKHVNTVEFIKTNKQINK